MILVTGAAGYIGSVTAELLVARGEQIVVLDNLERGHHRVVPEDVPFYEGNVGDRELIARIAQEHQVEACIHFAALAYVSESVANPTLYFKNNVEQGIALLDSLLRAGVKRFVFSSTCATYGEPQQVPIPEDHPRNPTNPYGWSKLMMEAVMESYDQAYGLSSVALRYFNAAGATHDRGEQHDPETHLVPNVLRAALGEIPALSVFGNDYPTRDGTAIRDYIHVADLGSAHILALDYLREGGASEQINLGNGQGYSVMEVIETAKRVTGREIPFKIEARRPGDPSRLIANADKAKELLTWNPAYPDLASIVRSDWEWRLKQRAAE
ncbi:MAG TPA: UDP-glucose 4-epimerase GalE [Pyrinomonadaceae bacterium]|jgi:UDP-glucose-4-epimerase GalE|nr:UDP-glucose 4-epimerase GalE [Pyrinomonadaceae bacterium]